MVKFLKILFAIIVIIIFLYFLDFSFLKGEIKGYQVTCDKDKYINYQCTEKWLPLGPTTYKPDPKNQIVFSWIGDFPVNKLTKCAVVNRKNWKCKYNDESAEFGFTNGKYWRVILDKENTISDDLSEFRCVSKWEYRLYQMKWW